MAILIRLFLGFSLPLVGCYSPELRNCTVTCETKADCASGQVCGEDRFCAAPAMAGRCEDPVDAPDAGPPVPPIDAPPDAVPRNELHVTITGKGTVIITGHGTCDSGEPQNGDCLYEVPLGIELTLQAVPHDTYVFDYWTSACVLMEETCTILPTTSTLAGARFRKLHDDD